MSAPIRLYLVRHGQALAGWGEDPDPGLSPLGHEQAAQVAQTLAPLGPMPVVTSPMRRTRETARAFADVWSVEPVVDERVSEIPSPSMQLEDRRQWLHGVMTGRWSDPQANRAGPHNLVAWRANVVAALLALRKPTVITSHFIAINVVVGAIQGRDEVICFRPNYCSITIVESDGKTLQLIETGSEAVTKVN